VTPSETMAAYHAAKNTAIKVLHEENMRSKEKYDAAMNTHEALCGALRDRYLELAQEYAEWHRLTPVNRHGNPTRHDYFHLDVDGIDLTWYNDYGRDDIVSITWEQLDTYKAERNGD
jgi:hypothetical protein